MIDFTDMDDLDGGKEEAGRTSSEKIRRNAHVVNGGDALFSCPSCKGSGKFISYSGRTVGPCYSCKGNGKISQRSLKGIEGAKKAKITKQENWARYVREHVAEIEFLRKAADWSPFAASMCECFRDEKKWTENQLAAIRRMMAKDLLRQEERDAKRAKEKEEREANAPKVDLAAIEKLFATATDNLIKRPIFRTERLDISKAPINGRNAGALYVTRRDEQGTYLGMLKDGKFFARREATKEDEEQLLAVAADPTDAAIKYARKTGRCGCCGKGLVNPVSIIAGIGPICSSKWGLDFMRELAETEYANMKAEEIKNIRE